MTTRVGWYYNFDVTSIKNVFLIFYNKNILYTFFNNIENHTEINYEGQGYVLYIMNIQR